MLQTALTPLGDPAEAHSPVQDTEERAAIDKKRQDAADLVEAKEMAAEEERARQWRVVRCSLVLEVSGFSSCCARKGSTAAADLLQV